MNMIFLSYSSKDKFFCELLEAKLRAEQIEVWRDVNSLNAGEEWRNSIDSGISKSKVIVLVLSRDSCESHYVTYEWANAIGQGKAILPVLLEDCNRHPKIEPLQYIDFKNHGDATWTLLVERLKAMIAGVELDERDDQSQILSTKKSLSPNEIVARDKIKAYLLEKGFRMMSRERIREKIDTSYSDDFLDSLITNVDEFAIAHLRGPKLGIKLR